MATAADSSRPLRIAVTRGGATHPESHARYGAWLRAADPTVHVVDILDDAAPVESCDGLLLSGGADIHPAYFGESDPDLLSRNVDRARDGMEFDAWARARKRRLPVLGICRGLQLVNVALGGSLILDLQWTGISGHGKAADRDVAHSITIEPASLVHSLTGTTTCRVNSAHHQAAGRVADTLRVTARSDDGVIEAMEWAETAAEQFLLLVQWHPERDTHNPALAGDIARTFLTACETSHVTRHT